MCVRTHPAPNILRYFLHGYGVNNGAVSAVVGNEALLVITPVGELRWMILVGYWVKYQLPHHCSHDDNDPASGSALIPGLSIFVIIVNLFR